MRDVLTCDRSAARFHNLSYLGCVSTSRSSLSKLKLYRMLDCSGSGWAGSKDLHRYSPIRSNNEERLDPLFGGKGIGYPLCVWYLCRIIYHTVS